MYNKEQVVDKVSQISRQRSKLDQLYVALQKSVASYKETNCTAKSVVKMRQNFNTLISEMSLKIVQRSKDLDALNYRCEKLAKQGENMSSQERNIQSLKQYFKDFKERLNQQKQKGQQFISEKQRWELRVDSQNIGQEQTSLLMSHKAARQTTQIADGVLSTLMNQQNRLMDAKNKMGNVLKNINLAANITMMIRTRSRQDNKLILWLTLGLVAQIILCLFVIRPMFRG